MLFVVSNAATCVSFSATETPAPSSWLDVPGTTVSARVQSFYYCWIRRRGTGTVHAQVIISNLSLIVIVSTVNGRMVY